MAENSAIQGRCGNCMGPYSDHRQRVAAGPICQSGRGVYRKATEVKLDAGYKAAFGDGPPKPIATFRLDDPASVERAKSVLSPEALSRFFGTGGGGMPAFMDAMEAAGTDSAPGVPS